MFPCLHLPVPHPQDGLPAPLSYVSSKPQAIPLAPELCWHTRDAKYIAVYYFLEGRVHDFNFFLFSQHQMGPCPQRGPPTSLHSGSSSLLCLFSLSHSTIGNLSMASIIQAKLQLWYKAFEPLRGLSPPVLFIYSPPASWPSYTVPPRPWTFSALKILGFHMCRFPEMPGKLLEAKAHIPCPSWGCSLLFFLSYSELPSLFAL